MNRARIGVVEGRRRFAQIGVVALLGGWVMSGAAGTVALWLFDEPEGLYPSSILNDASGRGLFLAFGRGARIVEGRFGRALEPVEPQPLKLAGLSAEDLFGLLNATASAPGPAEPLTWENAHFSALMTAGESHLRKPPFANPTETQLNVGDFDWTVEFWFCPTRAPGAEGVVFEIGQGPRGRNEVVTRLLLNADRSGFTLQNAAGEVGLFVPSDGGALTSGWHHFAFVYSAAEQQLRHYVDGRLQPLPPRAALRRLPHGAEAYFTVGRDGRWQRPLPGRLDELRFSDHPVYTAPFQPPGSFSVTYGKGLPKVTLKAGPPLLFGVNDDRARPVELGSRKHVFIDDALVAESQGIRFVPQPPRMAERVLDHVRGHLSLVEDETGLLRLYYRETGDYLAVMTSRDGIHWEKPDLGRGEFNGMRNIVVRYAVGLGNVFLDPNAPPESRWKYFSGIRKQAMFVFTSPDGWHFEPFEVAALPFSAGSQSIVYYDDQRQLYVGHHRSDYARMPGGKTQRRFVRSETPEVLGPWPWERIPPGRTAALARQQGLRPHVLDPWFLDNGPLTPCGPGIELPTVFGPDESLDPVGTDIYTTKVVKYPWAPDTYLAFPAVYFHYDSDGPPERLELGEKRRGRGSG
ncbi:MAG: LamG domain-containing protein, partial [Verrucomicrobiae bacterium]|nr:LamG domain-containing protein [Verrucomicrobiae bacterium]